LQDLLGDLHFASALTAGLGRQRNADGVADAFLQQILLRPEDYSVIATLNLNGITLTTGGNNASTQFDSAIAGPGSLTKTGGGTLTLAGPLLTDTGGTLASGVA